MSAQDPPRSKRRSAEVPIPVKIFRYSQRLVRQYDRNRDGRLDEAEWRQMQGNPRVADSDRDGVITVTELANRVARYGVRRKIRLMPSLSGGRIVLPSLLSPTTGPDSTSVADRTAPPKDGGRSAAGNESAAGSPSGRGVGRQARYFVPRTRLPQGLPAWFSLRDADGDAQLTMAEFAPKATQSELDDFARYDWNGDGVVTAQECVRGPKPTAEAAEMEAEKEAAEEGAEPAVDEATEDAAEDTTKEASGKNVEEPPAAKKHRKSRSKRSVHVTLSADVSPTAEV